MTLRILTVTSLYPSSAQPGNGVFIENRMARVHATGRAHVRVVAPVPWFPFENPRFGVYAAFAATPEHEIRKGVMIDHPRYPMAPKIGMLAQPSAYFQAALRRIRRIIEIEGPFDVIDAHYFYPDGVAAVRLGAALGLPVAISARGSDVTYIPTQSTRARAMIADAAKRADAVITVADALRDAVIDLGADPARTTTLRNGVDFDGFHPAAPEERAALRAKWGVFGDTPLLVSVGNLVPLKGHDLTIDAVAKIPGAHLLIAGDGPEREALERQISALDLNDRVRLLGRMPHEALRDLYAAADHSVLSSSREGWANVLLESMACGTPVVATAIWGTPEVVAEPAAGRLAYERSALGVRNAICAALAHPVDRAATQAYAKRFGWDETVEGVIAVLEAISRRRKAAA